MAKKIKDENGNVYVQKKPFYKRIWFILLVSLIVIGALGNLGGKNDSKEATNATTKTSKNKVSDSATTTSKATTDKKIFKVGEPVKVGDIEYIVNSKSTAQNVGGEFGKNASAVYLILNVTVKNNGTKAVTVDSNFFTLLKGKTEYSSDSSAGIYANDQADFFLSEVNPENSISGNVVFDVTQETIDNPELQLQVQTGVFGTEKEVISLNK
ncbi:DUF4352 domain-containing protein [Streptococcus dysgalactiae subsp. dysgalactiae]|nr:DUF4352 domain-containing protein [Streptococcus dysgalactiae]QGG97924.1 DUF4352 domain-containing protein [Streptococcus dysgalactiae subsp. dysgalactiae]